MSLRSIIGAHPDSRPLHSAEFVDASRRSIDRNQLAPGDASEKSSLNMTTGGMLGSVVASHAPTASSTVNTNQLPIPLRVAVMDGSLPSASDSSAY
jgi:hypothetical protein